MPKQVIACSTLCADGMAVHIDSEKAIHARNAVMEFLLINHPLDCPICDEAGECKLQDYTYKYSTGKSRFDEAKNQKLKRVALGPHVVFDAERCISCSRCIRFCEEVAGNPQLTFVNRGDRVTIQTLPGKSLDNPYSMNVIDICPVGALTSAEFRFKARVWDMASTDSVCPGCARGCNVRIWTKNNRIMRLTPRENHAVNGYWMCDRGRLDSTTHVHSQDRVITPSVKTDGVMADVKWDDALELAAEKLKNFAGNEIAFIGDPFGTCEDNYVLARFANEVSRSQFVGIMLHPLREDADDILVNAVRTPNAYGAQTAIDAIDVTSRQASLYDGLAKRTIKMLVVTDAHAFNLQSFADAVSQVEYFIAIVSNHSALTYMADLVIPSSTFAEVDGTFINCDGHVQRIRPAVLTEGCDRNMAAHSMSRLDRFGSEFDRWGRPAKIDARPAWSILCSIASMLGKRWGYRTAEDVYADMARRVEQLEGTSYNAIGRHGYPMGGRHAVKKPSYVYSDVHQ
jgi:NADH-quinone oxidoreductase subunit G